MGVEQRKTKRTKMVLPVKAVIAGTSYLAHTFDVTSVGARLGGLHAELKKGDTITLQRGTKKATFKVMWVQELSPKEIQAGLHAVEQTNNFWGIDFPEQENEGKNGANSAKDLAAIFAAAKK
jgi:hypothetical protein